MVKHYLLPALRNVDITDQFAFRPTGSTTAALVYIMHHVTRLLETNDYVRCLLDVRSRASEAVPASQGASSRRARGVRQDRTRPRQSEALIGQSAAACASNG